MSAPNNTQPSQTLITQFFNRNPSVAGAFYKPNVNNNLPMPAETSAKPLMQPKITSYFELNKKDDAKGNAR